MRFKSFQTRILVYIIGLMFLTMLAVFFAMHKANTTNARSQIDSALKITAGLFKKSLDDRKLRLLEKARLLSADYAFKEVSATGEHPTILSALNNQKSRIGADLMMLLSMDGDVIANTLSPWQHNVPFTLPGLIQTAMNDKYGEASSVEFMGGIAYQLVVVPLFAPEPSGWIVIGFIIDRKFTSQLQDLTKSHISILYDSMNNQWKPVASTLSSSSIEALSASISRVSLESDKLQSIQLPDGEYISFITRLNSFKSHRIIAALQRSLDEALQPYEHLNYILLLIFLLVFMISAAVSVLIARTVTRPVIDLAKGANKIANGHYEHSVKIRQQDELGQLAQSFNSMIKGLAERDRVRDLFGKVVSPAIADELMNRDVQLGGEEREVTIFFSDVRNFTNLCENRSPQMILSLLNTYLTSASKIIDINGGVVDKYIGDAVMALFGAPLQRDDDASNAVCAALETCLILQGLNEQLEKQGFPQIGIGIGINTGTVVAGNMGSISRLNYTVIGDVVNLASRLEGLTKKYGVQIIVSESTANMANSYVFREIDLVCVKGKREAVKIFEPIGCLHSIQSEHMRELDDYHAALHHYRNRNWDAALKQFDALKSKSANCKLYQIYKERVETFMRLPPAQDWDGVFIHHDK